MVWSKCGHCGHVNLVMIFFILSRCRLTPIKQRLMVMVQNLCWLCGADLLMPNRVEMSPRGFIVQRFAKILFLQNCEYMQEKMQKIVAQICLARLRCHQKDKCGKNVFPLLLYYFKFAPRCDICKYGDCQNQNF